MCEEVLDYNPIFTAPSGVFLDKENQGFRRHRTNAHRNVECTSSAGTEVERCAESALLIGGKGHRSGPVLK